MSRALRTSLSVVKEPITDGCSLSGRMFTTSRREIPDEVVTFGYAEDRWYLLDILKPHESQAFATVNFDLPKWLVDDAKRFIAYLWLEVGTYGNEVQQIMTSLRYLGRLIPAVRGGPIALRQHHSLQFQRLVENEKISRTHRKGILWNVNRFVAYVRQIHPEAHGNNFLLQVPARGKDETRFRPLGQSTEKKLSTDVVAAIINACAADIKAYYEARVGYEYSGLVPETKEYQRVANRRCKRRNKAGLKPQGHPVKLRWWLSKAIKASAVILMICVGRRAGAVCSLANSVQPKEVTWTNEAGQTEHAVLIRFREEKVRNIEEDVTCPGAFGELAVQAIATVRDLTADLRVADPRWGGFLFLTPAHKRDRALVLTHLQVNNYLNGRCRSGNKTDGLLKRFNIPCARVTTHNFRTTRATNLWRGGMQIHEVAQDLAHVGTEMTVRYYIVGTEESVRRLQKFMDHEALGGALIDFVGGQELAHERLSSRHVEIMREMGVVVVPTRYGYCAMHASLGPCDRTVPCYTGLDGVNCEYHLMSPDALPALREDKEVVEANISEYGNSHGYAAWVTNNRNQLVVINKKIEEAEELKRRAECSGQSCHCSQIKEAEAHGE